MKKLLFTLAVFFSVLSSYAQNDMREAILSYTDSTQLLIENGRQLIVKHIIDHNYAEAGKVLNYLKNKAGSNYVVLYPAEAILTSIATRDFQLFLYNARNFATLLEGKKKYPKYDDISYDLHANIREEMMAIQQDLELADLSVADRDFIQLYLDYYNGEDQVALRKKVNNYRSRFPDSEYQNFLKEIKSSSFAGRFNFGFGYLNERLSGEISHTIDPNISGLCMEMDFVMNRTYVSLYVGGSIKTLYSKTDLPILDTDWMYQQGNKVATIRYGLKVGYIVHSTNRVKTYPYVNIGGFSVTAQADDIDVDEKNELMGSFMPGVGMASEINLLKWNSASMYGPLGFLYLKPNVGIDFLTTKKEKFKGQSVSFSLTLGMAFGNF
tara:strand:- start:4579 stop:5721 length:1143 start_codon:yes stop_codon:yes gene_type:complete